MRDLGWIRKVLNGRRGFMEGSGEMDTLLIFSSIPLFLKKLIFFNVILLIIINFPSIIYL